MSRVARRHALAVVHPRRVPAFSGVYRRALVALAVLVAGVGLLYLIARETPLFALQTVTVAGAPPHVRALVLQEAEDVQGQSLVALDGTGLVRRIEALPSVLSARYDRAFPHTLRLFIVPERPLAVVHEGTNAWVVSERGRIMTAAEAGTVSAFPRVRLPEQAGLEPGGFVSDPGARVVLHALSLLPARFPVRVHAARLEEGELTFALAGIGLERPELRLGQADDLGVKLAVAALVLRSLGAEDRADLDYLDVSLPDRPVLGSKAQLST
jgi:cell division protein FtsQ